MSRLNVICPLFGQNTVSQVRRRVIRSDCRGIGFPQCFPLCTFSIPVFLCKW